MFDFIMQPWPWYVSGILIGLIVPLLLLIGNRSFGISSSLRHICAACVPANISFFKYNWKAEAWNLFFVVGIVLGGYLAWHYLSYQQPVNITPQTKQQLQSLGVTDFSGFVPAELFGIKALFTVKGWIFMVLGGFLVGFGARYAGGCTSGHAIMGLSTLQWPSLVATICFMIGGFFSTWVIIPYIFKLFG